MDTTINIDLTEGDVIDGKYRIERLLGAGGFKRVYKVRDMTSFPLGFHPRYYVLKQLKPLDNPVRYTRVLQQFEQEANILIKISTNVTHIPKIREYLAEYRCIVEEFIDGTTLSSLLRGNVRFPKLQALKYTRDICEALKSIHAHSILHRDVNPNNIMVTSKRAWLIDFGLAHVLATAGVPTPAVTSGIGTREYVAPEQKEGQPDRWSDIYSLGQLLRYMLYGQDTPTSHQKSVDDLINRMIADNPHERPTARGLYAELEGHIARQQLQRSYYVVGSLALVGALGIGSGSIMRDWLNTESEPRISLYEQPFDGQKGQEISVCVHVPCDPSEEITVPLPSDGTYQIDINQMISTEHTDTRMLPPGEIVQGTISDEHQVDRWWFQGTAGDVVSILMRGPDQSINPTITLHHADGPFQDEDNASMSRNIAVIADVRLPFDGVYIVETGAAYSGDYTLVLSINKPRFIRVGEQLPGKIATEGDFDTWVIHVPENQSILIRCEALDNTFDPYITFFQEHPQDTDNPLSNDDTHHFDALIGPVKLATGTYSLVVAGSPDALEVNRLPTGTYLLSIEVALSAQDLTTE